MANASVVEAVKSALKKALGPEVSDDACMNSQFWQLGGNSLLAAKMFQDIEHTLGMKVDMSAVSMNMTGSEIASAITKMQSGPR